MSDKWDALLSLSKGISGIGGMFGGPFAQMAGQSDDVATAAMVSRELGRQKEEAEKQAKAKKRGGLGGTVGSIGGSIVGNMILPGVGTALGAGIGNMAGSAAGQASAGGDIDMKELLKGGLEAGVSSYVAPKIIGAAGAAKGAAGAVGSAAQGMADGAYKLAHLPTWLGSHMAQWGGNSQLMRTLLGNTGAGIGNFAQGAMVRPAVRGMINGAMPSTPLPPGPQGMPAYSPYDERLALLNLW